MRPNVAKTETDAKSTARAITRRSALKAAGGLLGAGAALWALSPLARFAKTLSVDEILQQHYKQLSETDKNAIFARLEHEVAQKYAVDVDIKDPQPQSGVKFAYALNLSLCIGCRQCAAACHRENNHDRVTNNSYIRVFEMKQGSVDLTHARSDYNHAVPQPGHSYMPVQCHHCHKPPCVDVCPVKATWKETDGLVVIDYNWCIGCRYCEAACPYHARRFNWTTPQLSAAEINPEQGYLSNRLRPQGVMEKCTYCLHRTRIGKLPACLEACPAGARVFGNLRDPQSELRWILSNKRIFVLKEEWGTEPSFYYFFST
jgi:molybdopterin-containing oxidoreductase family iron-sulfur binding subunit